MHRPPFNPNRAHLPRARWEHRSSPPRRLFAADLLRTPPMTEGPFYPDKMPLDTDNDLIIVGKNTTPAAG